MPHFLFMFVNNLMKIFYIIGIEKKMFLQTAQGNYKWEKKIYVNYYNCIVKEK